MANTVPGVEMVMPLDHFKAGLPDVSVSRRGFMRVAGAAGVAIGAAGCLSACEAAAPAAEIIFNPATENWLGQLALAVGATEIENAIEDGLKAAWKAWGPGVRHAVNSQAAPYRYWYRDGWVHPVPPVVLVGVSRTRNENRRVDPMTDHMIACVNTGYSSVVFEPWAWQTLSMFVHYLTHGKSGAELTQTKELCALTLMPSGTRPKSGQSPGGSVGWLTYQSRNGHVEIAWSPGDNGSWNGIITASAIPDANGNPITKAFRLPAHAA